MSALSALRVFSLSHRTCGLSALAGVIASGDVAALRASIAASGVPAIVLSTCNRFEVYWQSREHGDDQMIASAIAASLPRAGDVLRDGTLQLSGEDAARHLFQVCSGLESMVLGEAEILGQARTAMELGVTAGKFLKGVFTSAIRTGRAARAETGIGVGAMSVASAAIEHVSGRIALQSTRVLLIGAGETGAKAARQIAAMGIGELLIANRTFDRARELAASCGATAVAFEEVATHITTADIVLCAAHSTSYLVTREHVADRDKPIVLVDLSMPPAIEPFTADHVTHIGLQQLQHATEDHRRQREAEIPRVNAIIDRELDWLRDWARHDMLRPFVSTLRQKAEIIRRDELERAITELNGDDPERVLERFSRRMFDRFLSVPVEQLQKGHLPFDGGSVDYLRRLFALDDRREAAPRGANTEGES